MNLIKSNFAGIDIDNEISLLEYGLLVYKDKHEDNSGTQFCVYRIDNDSFGCGHIAESEINELLKGNEWADKDSLSGFYDYVGSNKDEYLSLSLANKLFDLASYYGYENIFDTDYSPMSEKEATERYL